MAGGHLVVAAGTNTRGFEHGAAGGSLHGGAGVERPCNMAGKCPPWLPGWCIKLSEALRPNAAWSRIADFPGGGMDVPNSAGVNGALYMFGGWRANFAGMQAWCQQEAPGSLYQLGLPVPITIGTNGARLLRYAWKYTVETDTWARLPAVPQHVCQGALGPGRLGSAAVAVHCADRERARIQQLPGGLHPPHRHQCQRPMAPRHGRGERARR